MKNKFYFLLIILAVSSCSLINNEDILLQNDTMEWTSDTTFLIMGDVIISEYEYRTRDYLININQGSLRREETFPEYRSVMASVNNSIVSPDKRYVWGTGDGNKLLRHDMTLGSEDNFNYTAYSLAADWDSMRMMLLVNSDSVLVIGINDYYEEYLTPETLSDSAIEITSLNNIFSTTRNGKFSWVISASYVDESGDSIYGMLFLDRNYEWQESERIDMCHGMPSPNCKYFVYCINIYNAPSQIRVYDSTGVSIKTINY